MSSCLNLYRLISKGEKHELNKMKNRLKKGHTKEEKKLKLQRHYESINEGIDINSVFQEKLLNNIEETKFGQRYLDISKLYRKDKEGNIIKRERKDISNSNCFHMESIPSVDIQNKIEKDKKKRKRKKQRIAEKELKTNKENSNNDDDDDDNDNNDGNNNFNSRCEEIPVFSSVPMSATTITTDSNNATTIATATTTTPTATTTTTTTTTATSNVNVNAYGKSTKMIEESKKKIRKYRGPVDKPFSLAYDIIRRETYQNIKNNTIAANSTPNPNSHAIGDVQRTNFNPGRLFQNNYDDLITNKCNGHNKQDDNVNNNNKSLSATTTTTKNMKMNAVEYYERYKMKQIEQDLLLQQLHQKPQLSQQYELQHQHSSTNSIYNKFTHSEQLLDSDIVYHLAVNRGLYSRDPKANDKGVLQTQHIRKKLVETSALLPQDLWVEIYVRNGQSNRSNNRMIDEINKDIQNRKDKTIRHCYANIPPQSSVVESATP